MADQFISKANIRRRLVDMGALLGANYWAELFAVSLTTSSGAVTPAAPLPVMEGFDIPAYDYVNSPGTATPSPIVFKTGGSGGTTVATLTITYDGSGYVTSVTRT